MDAILAGTIVLDYARKHRVRLNPSEASNLAFVLADFDVQVACLERIVVTKNGEIVTHDRYGRNEPETLTGLLDGLTRHLPRDPQ